MAIRWDKLTVKTQEAFQRANDLAAEHGNPEVMPVHLLAALLEDREGSNPSAHQNGRAAKFLAAGGQCAKLSGCRSWAMPRRRRI